MTPEETLRDEPDEQDRKQFRAVRKRADKARDFPTHTDPCSRHAYIMADCMVKKRGYPMLAEEPWHCAISIMATVAALWETRARLALVPVPEETLREALAELVACKDLKTERDTAEETHHSTGVTDDWRRHLALSAEYERRKPLAWEAARRALAIPPSLERSVYPTESDGEAVQRPADGDRA